MNELICFTWSDWICYVQVTLLWRLTGSNQIFDTFLIYFLWIALKGRALNDLFTPLPTSHILWCKNQLTCYDALVSLRPTLLRADSDSRAICTFVRDCYGTSYRRFINKVISLKDKIHIMSTGQFGVEWSSCSGSPPESPDGRFVPSTQYS